MVIHIFDCFRPRKLEDGIDDHQQQPSDIVEKEDRISGLPTDILIHIVSLLPPKEAVRTCTLSKRWQEIPSFCVRFDFDAVGIFGWRVRFVSDESFNEGRRKYINWVSKSIELADDAMAIDEFRIQFNLDNSFREEIDEWMRYAFARKVKRLELDLNGPFYFPHVYDFPRRLLLNPSDGWFLRSLILRKVSVSDEDIKVLLQTFRLLEYLEVSGSPTLKRVEVCGPPVLKHLVIYGGGYGSPGGGSIIIRDAHSLVTLESDYWSMHNLEIENSPNLVHARLPGSGWFINKVPEEDPNGHYIPNHPTFFSRLQVLTLDVGSPSYIREKVTHVPTQLTELKQLHLNVRAAQHQGFFYLTPLLMECPKLEKLTLKLLGWDFLAVGILESEPLQDLNFCLHRLQIVEFQYCGRSTDDEFVRILLENSPALHTISIHPQVNAYFRATTLAADRLKRSVDLTFPSVEFVII